MHSIWKLRKFTLIPFWQKFRQSKKLLEMGTAILNRRHFDFYHGDAPCFKLDILNLNFPPHRYKYTTLHSQVLNPRWSRGSMLGWQLEGPGFEFWQPAKKTFLHFSTKSGGKFKLSMSNLKQGASPW